MKDGRNERKTINVGAKRRIKAIRKMKEGEEKKRSEQFLFPAALFNSGTPLVARSTAEAASQSPLPVCPVTLHQRGQRALRLPINEPASASVPPRHFPNSHNSVRDKTQSKGKRNC